MHRRLLFMDELTDMKTCCTAWDCNSYLDMLMLRIKVCSLDTAQRAILAQGSQITLIQRESQMLAAISVAIRVGFCWEQTIKTQLNAGLWLLSPQLSDLYMEDVVTVWVLGVVDLLTWSVTRLITIFSPRFTTFKSLFFCHVKKGLQTLWCHSFFWNNFDYFVHIIILLMTHSFVWCFLECDVIECWLLLFLSDVRHLKLSLLWNEKAGICALSVWLLQCSWLVCVIHNLKVTACIDETAVPHFDVHFYSSLQVSVQLCANLWHSSCHSCSTVLSVSPLSLLCLSSLRAQRRAPYRPAAGGASCRVGPAWVCPSGCGQGHGPPPASLPLPPSPPQDLADVWSASPRIPPWSAPIIPCSLPAVTSSSPVLPFGTNGTQPVPAPA